MHTLLLLGWLGATATGSNPPITIQVETHALADHGATKGASPAARLAADSRHEMHASIDANGRVAYDCADVGASAGQRTDARTTREEH